MSLSQVLSKYTHYYYFTMNLLITQCEVFKDFISVEDYLFLSKNFETNYV